MASLAALLNIARPLTPDPVPISTIFFAPSNPAIKVNSPAAATVGSVAPT